MNLTKSQQAALAIDKNISVTAGAGSGKTRILVDRFLKIALQQPALTKNIVAITFTEKAAAEMQERIAEEVNSRLLKENLNPAERKNLQYIRDQLSSAHISTIHGFCMRILQEFPIQANVTPDFTILDPIRQQVLMHSAIKSAFENLDKNALQDEGTDWFSLFIALPRRRISDMLATALDKPYEMSIIKNEFEKRTKGEYIAFLTKHWLEIFNTVIKPEFIDSAFLFIKRILENDTVQLKNEKAQELQSLLKLFSEAYSQDQHSLDTCGAILNIASAFTTKGNPYKNLSYLGKKDGWDKSIHKNIIELSEFLSPVQKRIMDSDPGAPPDETDEKWYDLFNTFLKLYTLASENFRLIKEEHGTLDFEDLQIYTMQLLQENEETRQKLNRRFRYIMVDEFQDTNPVQWKIVELLTSHDGKMSKDQAFVVGDPKQSIYGFRDADIRIFKNVVQSFSTNAGGLFSETYNGNIVFKESFRFLPQINAFINHFFSNILQSDSSNPFEVHYENLTAQREIAKGSRIDLTLIDEENEGQSEAEYIARRINSLIDSRAEVYESIDGKEQSRPARYGDVAILIRDRSSLSDIEQALRQNNVPFKTVGGIGFWQRQEIYDIYHILRFLSTPADDLALVAMLRSRLFLLSDNAMLLMTDNMGIGYFEKLRLLKNDFRLTDQEKHIVTNAYDLINKWLHLRERLTLAELLNAILDDSKLFALLNAEFSGEQRTANLQKVVELADSFDQSGPGGMRAFLDIIDDLINREVAEGEAFLALDDIASVKIMTIHVSKGLQFPIVFTPYLNRSMRAVGSDIMLDRELGMAVTFKNDDDFYGDKTNENTLYRLLRLRQKQKDLAELKRIFYVAVSRASDYLFLSATVKDQRVQSNSMFKWLEDCLINESKSSFFPGTLQYEDFILHVMHGYEKEGEKPLEKTGFYKMMDELEKADSPIHPETDFNIVSTIPVQTYGRIFSATALMTFSKNPDEYYQRYHLGFFEGDYEQGLVEKTDDIDSLLKGKIVHRFLEIYNSQEEKADEVVEKILFDYEIYDISVKKQLTTELLKIKQMMLDSEMGKRISASSEYKNEVSLTMRLDDDFFTGTIDRLQKNSAGEWEIIDYKTNRITPEQLEKTASDYEIQIKSYALLLAHLYPQQKSFKVTFYFLTVDNIFEKIFNQDDINSIVSEFKHLIREIKHKFPVN